MQRQVLPITAGSCVDCCCHPQPDNQTCCTGSLGPLVSPEEPRGWAPHCTAAVGDCKAWGHLVATSARLKLAVTGPLTHQHHAAVPACTHRASRSPFTPARAPSPSPTTRTTTQCPCIVHCGSAARSDVCRNAQTAAKHTGPTSLMPGQERRVLRQAGTRHAPHCCPYLTTRCMTHAKA